MHRITLYTRAGCCLCDDVKSVLATARGQLSFEYEEVDIDSDSELQRLYNDYIPVVAIDGVASFRYRVELQQLLERLE
jgi:glutaredoxin